MNETSNKNNKDSKDEGNKPFIQSPTTNLQHQHHHQQSSLSSSNSEQSSSSICSSSYPSPRQTNTPTLIKEKSNLNDNEDEDDEEKPNKANFIIDQNHSSSAELPASADNLSKVGNLRRRIKRQDSKDSLHSNHDRIATKEEGNQNKQEEEAVAAAKMPSDINKGNSEELASFLPGSHDVRMKARNKNRLGGLCGVIMRKRRMILYLTLSIILGSQLWLWGPSVVGEEKMNAWGGTLENWKSFRPHSGGPPPPIMDSDLGILPPHIMDADLGILPPPAPPPPAPPPPPPPHPPSPPPPPQLPHAPPQLPHAPPQLPHAPPQLPHAPPQPPHAPPQPPAPHRKPKRPPPSTDSLKIGIAANGMPIYKPKWDLPLDYSDPLKEEEESLAIESDSAFPPEVIQFSTRYKPAKANYNYKDGDPHLGVIPLSKLAILERDIPRKLPIRKNEPINFPAERYISKGSWSRSTHGSTSVMEDSLNPDAQPIEKDWRPSPYKEWQPPKINMNLGGVRSPGVQYAFSDPTRFSGEENDKERDALIEKRRRLVRSAFLHSWEAYKEFAWGHDEIRPMSGDHADSFNGWGATIVDALDTLLIMDLPAEYDLARQHVRDIDFHFIGGSRSAYGVSDGNVPVFETAIRYLGGFLSAYDLSGDELMRDRAEELGQLILPAFETLTGVPIGRLNLNQPPQRASSGSVIVAEAASMLLEMTRLWQVTGNRTYFDRVQRTTDWLQYNMTASPDRLGTLLPSTIFPEHGTMYGWYSWGGMVDSAFEYLIKEHQLLGGRLDQYGKFFSDSVDSARRWLMRGVNSVPNTPLLIMGHSNGKSHTPKLEHLACFTGGSVGLGAKLLNRKHDLQLARRITEACWWAYNSTETGIGPESMTFYRDTDQDRFEVNTLKGGTARRGKPKGAPVVGVKQVTPDYRGRPETIESVYYMWRLTGDRQWQERGWQMFSSWVTHSLSKYGFASINNVLHFPASLSDSMESYVFAETFKYYYLLFSPPNLISLDDYVFSTEAHPFLLPTKSDGKWGIPGKGPKRFWDPNAIHLPTSPDQYSGGERGLVGGLTRTQKHFIYEEWQKALELEEQAKLLESAKKLKAVKQQEETNGADLHVAEDNNVKPVVIVKSDEGEKDAGNDVIVKLLDDVQRRASNLGNERGKSFLDELNQLLTSSSEEVENDENGEIKERTIEIDRRELEQILTNALESVNIPEDDEGEQEEEEAVPEPE